MYNERKSSIADNRQVNQVIDHLTPPTISHCERLKYGSDKYTS